MRSGSCLTTPTLEAARVAIRVVHVSHLNLKWNYAPRRATFSATRCTSATGSNLLATWQVKRSKGLGHFHFNRESFQGRRRAIECISCMMRAIGKLRTTPKKGRRIVFARESKLTPDKSVAPTRPMIRMQLNSPYAACNTISTHLSAFANEPMVRVGDCRQRYLDCDNAASLRTVFQFRAVPRTPSFCSTKAPVSLERPMPSG